MKEKPDGSKKLFSSGFNKFSKNFLDIYKLYKLKKSIRYAYNNAPFYKKLFKKNNIQPDDIKSFSDLPRIPCTRPEDLENDPKAFFSVPENRFVKVFTTAGTTGSPKKAYFTKEDIDSIVLFVATGGKILYNITQRDRIRLTFEVGYATELWGTSYILDRAYGKGIGALTLSTGRLPVKNELEILREYKPNIIGDVTSRINYLTNEMTKICDVKELGVQKFLIGAEPTTNAMRKRIEQTWNADVFIGYGINEVGLLMAGECEEKNGMHLSEMNYLLEVIDPETNEQLEDGEVGELLYTTFDRMGMPLIRYNSHDLGKVIPGMCRCGLPLRRIVIKGRTDDMIPIGAGDNLFSNMFDEAMFKIPEVIEYNVIFDREDGKDTITILAECRKTNNSIRKKIFNAVVEIPKIKDGIQKSKTIGIPKITLVQPNTFDRNSIKMKRIIDNRNLYE